jgi:hypothetical protein
MGRGSIGNGFVSTGPRKPIRNWQQNQVCREVFQLKSSILVKKVNPNLEKIFLMKLG